MTPELLIINATLLPAPGNDTIIDPAFVVIAEGKITALGPMPELSSTQARQVIDAADNLVMPGLVNTHCHAAMTLFRGLADDLALVTWLTEHIFPAEAKNVNPEMVYWCSKLAAAEMILSGTTLVGDGYFYEEEAARAFADAGLRAVAAQGVIDFPAPGVPDPRENIAVAERFLTNWRNHPLITPAVFAHAPYTCGIETLQRAKNLARAAGVPFFIHLAETAGEHGMIREPRGDSPVKHLAALDVLDEETVAVHGVWLSEEDLRILAQHDCKCSVCFQSNLKLASGIAPLGRMLAHGLAVGLGTDGAASNNSLDLFREMDLVAKILKYHEMDPVALPAAKILNLATAGGATVLGHPHLATGLAPGAPADLILIDSAVPHLHPFYRPDLLVYAPCGGNVRTTIIAGRPVMHDRRILTFDLEETKAKVRQLARQLR